MDIGTLIDCYMANRSNKRRSRDSVHFELHWERDLMRLLDDINSRTLDPFLYSFIRTKPRPREVIAGLMPMKIIQEYFDERVRPLVESRLTGRTFNNRIGYGCNKAIERLIKDVRDVSHNYTRPAYIITRDIKAYFPSTDLNKSYERYRKLIEDNFVGDERDDLLYILMRVNYAYPQDNAKLIAPRYQYDDIIASGKSVVFNNDYDHGGCLGNQYWQVQKNYDLADFDRWQVVDCGMHYGRFVDDMWWVVDNLPAGLAHVATSEKKLLEEEGYIMHPNKRYQQHYSKGVKFLGVHIKFDRVYTNDRTIRNCRMAIRKWNRLAYPSQLEHFLASINSSFGLMKHRNDYGKIRDLVEEVSPKWLKYCHYNDDRRCFEPNEGYKHNEILIRRYGFRFNKLKHRRYDTTADRRAS